MRWSVRAAWFWIVSVLMAIGMVAVIAGQVVRQTVDILHAILIAQAPSSARAEAGRWLRACVFIAQCRGVMVWALGQSLHAHEPALRVTWGLVISWIVCALFFRSRMPFVRSAAGSARYAFPRELRCLRVHTGEAWLPLGYLPPSRFVKRLLRFSPGRRAFRALVGSQVCLPAEDLARHVLVLGLTGAHKTTAVTFPVLLEAARRGVSVVALDLKYGEADSLARAAPEWQRWARDILIFAPVERATLRWNPLDRCRSMGDAYQLSAQLFDDPDPSDPALVYWLGAERHVFAVLCFALAADTGPATLGRLRSLCESGPAAVHAYVRAHPAAGALVPRLGAYEAMLPQGPGGDPSGDCGKA